MTGYCHTNTIRIPMAEEERTALLTTWLSNEEYESVKERATSEGLSVEEYFRKCCLAPLHEDETD